MMPRRPCPGFTLVEVLIATIVTAIVAAAVAATLSAVSVGLRGQDEAAQEVARIARAQSRLCDHLYRARMILAQSADSVVLWLPSEQFDGTASNATAFDTIHTDELRWYRFDRARHSLLLQKASGGAARSVHGLSSDWEAVRSSLSAAGSLSSSMVLEGIQDAAFRFSAFDRCRDRRIALEVQLDDAHGGLHLEFGGALAALQRHPDCQ